MFTVSINPTYLCNFRCDFCYLTKEQLCDKTTIPLDVLKERLEYINSHREITHIDIYGGEVTLLSEAYVESMMDIIATVYEGRINVITNLSRPLEKTEWLLRPEVDISVSWDYTCREGWDSVMKNILLVPKPIHMLMLASKEMVHWEDHQIGAAQWIIDSLNNVATVEIKPYSPNQANQEEVSYSEYEGFIRRWLNERAQGRYSRNEYEFVNETQIFSSITRTRNAYSDDHIYLTPHGKLAVLDFDLNDNEYFLELETFDAYLTWAEREKERVTNNEYCKECPYLGHCLSEHLRDVKSLENSCNGFRHLLEWYDTRIQIKTGDVS